MQHLGYVTLQLIFACIFLSYAGPIKHFEIGVVLSFAPIGAICIWSAARAWTNDGYSIRVVFWFFTYWFAFLVPLAAYMTGRWWYGDMSVSQEGRIAYANACILAFTSVFSLFYRSGSRRNWPAVWMQRIANRNPSPTWTFRTIVIAACAAAGLYAAIGNAMFFRPSDLVQVSAGEKPLHLLLAYLVRPVPVFALLLGLSRWLHMGQLRFSSLAFVGVCLLLTNSPTAVARYYLFGVVYAIIAVAFVGDRLTKCSSLVLLWGGTFVAFLLHPVRYLGKQYGSLPEIVDAYKGRDIVEYFFDGHYAAYEIFVIGLQMIEENGLSLGRQVLGTVASWVPRLVWEGKPDHTGKLIMESAVYRISNTGYDNISAPVYMESMVDFGWIGLIVFAGLLGYAAGRFDAVFCELRRVLRTGERKTTGKALLYAVLAPIPALSFLFWRGSWMPAFGYLVGTTISGFLILRFLTANHGSRDVILALDARNAVSTDRVAAHNGQRRSRRSVSAYWRAGSADSK